MSYLARNFYVLPGIPDQHPGHLAWQELFSLPSDRKYATIFRFFCLPENQKHHYLSKLIIFSTVFNPSDTFHNSLLSFLHHRS